MLQIFLQRGQSTGGVTLPDFSGFNITELFSVFKTSEATSDLCFRIYRNGVDTARYVFYDAGGEISATSQVSTTTTADEATTLQDLFDSGTGTDFYTISEWYCQITGAKLDNSGTLLNAPRLAENTTINTTNSKPAVKFTGATDCYFDKNAGGFSSLDTGNSFSISTVSNNSSSSSLGVVVSNNRTIATSNDSRIAQYNDRGVNKYVSLIRNTGGTNYLRSVNSVHNNASQKRLTTVLSGTTKSNYFNASVQTSTATITGSWVNDNFSIGAQRVGATLLTGNVQFVAVHSVAVSSGNVTSLDGKLNDYFIF